MELVALKCPKCGGELEVHEGQKKTFCKYCGSQIHHVLDALGKIITNILTALYEPFGFSALLSFLAMFFYFFLTVYKV